MVKAGKFFILGFDGTTVPSSLNNLFMQYGLGGVILFDRNIKTSEQLKELTAALRIYLSEDIIISIDQEGGDFQRLKPPQFAEYLPAYKIKKRDIAYDIGLKMGYELAGLGINLNFAPVLDVNTNPNNPIIGKRSFGSKPQHVAEIGMAFIHGLHEGRVIACGKHFPGHGDTCEDSHLELPIVVHPMKRLESVELIPFHKAVESGIKSVMTAHVLYPALDPDYPATFSKRILTDLLRKEWGYEGLVISDDMGMAGALSRADLSDACIQAFAAGCDLVLVCEHHDRHEEIIEALRKAIDKSCSLQKRAEESVNRIRKILDNRLHTNSL